MLSCSGMGTSGQANLTLQLDNIITGQGVLDGVPIVTTNMLDGGNQVYSLVGWPKSQDTGNPKDILHKIQITVNRYTGDFNVIVSNAKNNSIVGRLKGACNLSDKPKF